MPDFPISLDKLISYIKAQRPEGDPLEQLSEAVNVAARLEEQSDAVIGYFVEQARASGESWSQIGASMGVSKQAAQKRFVLRADDLGAESKAFSRFTPRARNAVATAGQTAAAAGADAVDATYLAAGLLTEPEGLAVKIVRRLGVTEK
ncbi:MAG TPA: hypothetical protein VEJ87_14985, partial [Acidimicrobiales bacterium]|nr:hypothetical protein [Acidimicrobiales bacterium]